MGSVKCYDDAMWMILLQSAARLGSKYKINPERLKLVKDCCKLLDALDKTCDIGGCGGSVDIEDTLDVTVNILCDDFSVRSVTSEFYAVVDKCKEVIFDPAGGDFIQISFVFDGIFENPTGDHSKRSAELGKCAKLAFDTIKQIEKESEVELCEDPEKAWALTVCCNTLDSLVSCIKGRVDNAYVDQYDKSIVITIASQAYSYDDIREETDWWPYQWMRERAESISTVRLGNGDFLTIASFEDVWYDD